MTRDRLRLGRAGVRTGVTSWRVSLALLVAGLGLGGCDRSPARQDANRIILAFEAFQKAGTNDKKAALDSLRAAPCAEAETCHDRDACVAYATALVRSRELAGKARVLGPVDAGGNGAATPSERALFIASAEDALQLALRSQSTCEMGLRRLGLRAGK